MNVRKQIALIFFEITTIVIVSCNNAAQPETSVITKNKVANAISCTINGLTVADSTVYANGGGNEFKETAVNKNNYPGTPADGMVWIPGGEFSMGGVNPVGMSEGGHEQMDDARPVHR